jgi:hypothetical protein
MRITLAAMAGALLVTALSFVSMAAGKPDVGATAPKTVLQSVNAGKIEPYDLQSAAATRPVVLYFFPQAFSSG